MRFVNDNQRKAMFARMGGYSKFSKKSSLEFAAEDISRGDMSSKLIETKKEGSPIKLPEGTQAAFLVSDYGSYVKTKEVAREAAESLSGGGQKAYVVPIWDGDELRGHAVVSYQRGGGSSPRQYMPGAEDLESARQSSMEFVRRDLEATPEVERPAQPPISDRFKEYEARLLTSGVSREEAAKEAEALKLFEGDADEKKYIDSLLGAFETSGEEDFYKFKKDFDLYYREKKSMFSKKSKEDYFAVIQRGDDEYVCSFCGDVFSNRMTAARHAGRCDGNSFNDKENEYEEEDVFDDDVAPDGFSL